MSSIFTKIINGEIPSYKIFEDEYTFVFLDINPIQVGHALVVPKIEVDYFIDVPEPYYTAVFRTAKVVSKAIQEATNCTRVGTIIAGFDVAHFHYHLIPLHDMSDFNFSKAKARTEDEMLEMQEKIKSFLS